MSVNYILVNALKLIIIIIMASLIAFPIQLPLYHFALTGINYNAWALDDLRMASVIHYRRIDVIEEKWNRLIELVRHTLT